MLLSKKLCFGGLTLGAYLLSACNTVDKAAYVDATCGELKALASVCLIRLNPIPLNKGQRSGLPIKRMAAKSWIKQHS